MAAELRLAIGSGEHPVRIRAHRTLLAVLVDHLLPERAQGFERRNGEFTEEYNTFFAS